MTSAPSFLGLKAASLAASFILADPAAAQAPAVAPQPSQAM